MERVGALKNQIFRETLAGGYDGVWLVDSDLICGPRTLWSLWYSDAPMVCGVFWTKWQDRPDCPLMPQVWLRHPYQLDGRGMDGPEFLRKLINRERVQVWGQGACTLYRPEPLQKGVSFDRVPDLPTEGMWVGEDRHLCTRAERLHLPMIADAWPDIFHGYHPHQQTQGEEWLGRLSEEVLGSPKLGDLVSLHLRALEPIQMGNQWGHLRPLHVRGQIGKLHLLPQLETAIQEMGRGETRIVSCAYPAWSSSPHRGQTKLMQVTLVDWKANAFPVGF